MDRTILKESAKDMLAGKWGTGVSITLVYLLITLPFSIVTTIKDMADISWIFSITSIFVFAPLYLGITTTYVILVKSGNLVLGNLFSGFRLYSKSLGLYLWLSLWIILWSLLLIVPGIIKAFSYSQAMFIVADDPNVTVRDSLKISMKMTDGYKWDIFVMGLSFLGWILLSMITLFIGMLWLSPYMITTFTNMYYKLKELSIQSGKCTEEMFNGTTRLVQ